MAAPDNQSLLQQQVPVKDLSVSPLKSRPGFFQDDTGSTSSLRMMCMASLITAIVFGFLTLYLPNAGENGIYFTLVSLVGAFAPKAIHKVE
ncbi:MAG: hypothetical protein FDX18_02635 [Chlorobium sp.]|nr:MAG: hypothetical protein FDX18_02635 [Chlorobium sp.]